MGLGVELGGAEYYGDTVGMSLCLGIQTIKPAPSIEIRRKVECWRLRLENIGGFP